MSENKHIGSSFTQYMLEDYEAQAKENHILKEENKALKAENEALKRENKTGYAVLCVDLARVETENKRLRDLLGRSLPYIEWCRSLNQPSSELLSELTAELNAALSGEAK